MFLLKGIKFTAKEDIFLGNVGEEELELCLIGFVCKCMV